MKNLLKILVPVLGLNFCALNYTNAQTQDTIFLSKISSVVEENYNKAKTFSEKKEYVIEKISELNKDGKIRLETETKYSFKEKDLGKSGEQKNLLNRKQIDKLLDYITINEYRYDSLGRLIEIEKIEDYSPGENIKKRSKTYYAYNGENKNPVNVWDDLNNDGKFNQGDKMKVYIPELDKWVSHGE